MAARKRPGTNTTAKEIVKRVISDKELDFIQGHAALLAPWGLPPSAGRVYGYLMLLQEPVSLDQIATDLEMSKAGTWSVAKDMESFGHIRRFSVPGSKRSLYAPSDDFSIPIAKQARLLADMATLIQQCADNVATGDAAIKLADRAEFYSTLSKATASVIADWKKQRGQA